MLRRLICALIIACLVPATTGCSFTQPMLEKVTVKTDRPAEIYQGGKKIGETTDGNLTLTLELPRNESARIGARAGDLEARGRFEPRISTLGILDIIGTFFFLIPIVTVFTGHAFELDPVTLELELDEKSSPPPGEDPGDDPFGGMDEH